MDSNIGCYVVVSGPPISLHSAILLFPKIHTRISWFPLRVASYNTFFTHFTTATATERLQVLCRQKLFWKIHDHYTPILATYLILQLQLCSPLPLFKTLLCAPLLNIRKLIWPHCRGRIRNDNFRSKNVLKQVIRQSQGFSVYKALTLFGQDFYREFDHRRRNAVPLNVQAIFQLEIYSQLLHEKSLVKCPVRRTFLLLFFDKHNSIEKAPTHTELKGAYPGIAIYRKTTSAKNLAPLKSQNHILQKQQTFTKRKCNRASSI